MLVPHLASIYDVCFGYGGFNGSGTGLEKIRIARLRWWS